jgi:hypothetical protein
MTQSTKRLKIGLIGALVLLLCNGCVLYRATFSGLMAEHVHRVAINLKEKDFIQQGHNRVYYSQESKNLAKGVLQILAAQEEMITDSLGLGSENFGVVIVQKAPERKASYTVDARLSNWEIWPLDLDNPQVLSHADEFEDLYHTMLHERAEGAVKDALIKKGDLYRFNRETRWIGDGLAELLAFRFSREHSPVAAADWLSGRWLAVKQSQENWHVSRYNLKEFKGLAASGSLKNQMEELKEQFSFMSQYPVFTTANYAMSFYYWASLEEELGPQAIKDVISKLQHINNPTNENIERVISDVAGRNYVERIEQLSADEALAFFQEEIRRLIPTLMEALRSEQRHLRTASYEALRGLDKEAFQVDLSGIPTTAVIQDIIPGCPAYQAGLRPRDLIEYVNGALIEDFDKFLSDADTFGPAEIEVSVLRAGQQKSFRTKSFAGCLFGSIAR